MNRRRQLRKERALRPRTPVPANPDAWLEEVARAWRDAAETLPFAPLVGHDMKESDLFHLGPAVCLKFRGIKASASNLKRATEAALSSYVATSDASASLFEKPQVAFAFCYVASHFGLGLIDEGIASRVLGHIEANTDALLRKAAPE